ncbi:hypothetical protein WIT60_05705 [Aquabacterium sp. G14]|uniref:hypothetical protein n=1 Tax=Aquabacterium sp. G14 TaxID=3130164 RepID=UPI0030AC569D
MVLMRAFGLESPRATIEANEKGWHGEAFFPGSEAFAKLDDPPLDHSGVIAATAASVFHAGVIAEMIDAGATWTGPILYAEASDFQRANDMLRPAFGNNASGAHAFAQQVALHILSTAWSEVEAIAEELMRGGEWVATS